MRSLISGIVRDILSKRARPRTPANPSDKRASERFGIRVVVPVQIAGTERTQHIALRNLSSSGVGLMHPASVAVGSLLTIRLPSIADNGLPESREMQCRVTRCEQAAEGVFMIGAAFLAPEQARTHAGSQSARSPGAQAPRPTMELADVELTKIRAAILD